MVAKSAFVARLSSLAYVMFENIRHLCLGNTDFPRYQVSTIRIKLLEIDALLVGDIRQVGVDE
jgi:hypothetical protein